MPFGPQNAIVTTGLTAQVDTEPRSYTGTLTIGAGATLAFEPGSNAGFQVGTSSQPGSLTINGTNADPVTLTSAAATPTAGDWPGLVFAPGAGSAGSVQSINHAIIEYTGADTAYPTALTSDGTYYWRVLAEDALGNTSAWSAVGSFEIDVTSPAAPAVISPADGAVFATATVTFAWMPAPTWDGFVSYNYQRLENGAPGCIAIFDG